MIRRFLTVRNGFIVVGTIIGIGVYPSQLSSSRQRKMYDLNMDENSVGMHAPDRFKMMQKLKSGEMFDLLVIGGGATGAGAALDAAARGLKVACVEREDIASGTSSRSTKLIWGGSRYLIKAFVTIFSSDLRLIISPVQTMKAFLSELKMVMNCHRERKFLLMEQPHLTNWVPIAVPITSWIMWPAPFGFLPAALGPLGLFPLFFKVYDAMGDFCSPPSHIMTPRRQLRKFSQLRDDIKYCSIFYEGQHDDARTNLAIALTAAKKGAAVGNYCNVIDFIKDTTDKDKVVGAVVRDELTRETFTIKARSIVFCGGPFTDELRKMEDAKAAKAIDGASGIHIVLPSYYAPDIGLVDMSTSDGRFLFLLPWQGHVLVGTTDKHCSKMEMNPIPPEEQIQWLLKECSKYLNPELQVRRQDILSAWSGIRPLAIDPHATATSSASRDHVVSHNPKTGVIFISGGKWTTYREMAEDLVDKAIDVSKLDQNSTLSPCTTLNIALHGRDGYTVNLPIRLSQQHDIPITLAKRLALAYGGMAVHVITIMKDEKLRYLNLSDVIVSGHAYSKAEIIYSIRHEWAVKAEDIIARRMRLAFLDKAAALKAIPVVVAVMASELKWSKEKQAQEIVDCTAMVSRFGGPTVGAAAADGV